jgi:hypothetical protein
MEIHLRNLSLNFNQVADSNIVMLAIPVNSGQMVRMDFSIQCVPGTKELKVKRIAGLPPAPTSLYRLRV